MASTNQTIEKAYCQFWQKSGFYEVERVRKHTKVLGDSIVEQLPTRIIAKGCL